MRVGMNENIAQKMEEKINFDLSIFLIYNLNLLYTKFVYRL